MSKQAVEVRPSVLAFAQAIEEHLRRNPIRSNITVDELIDRATDSIGDLFAAWQTPHDVSDTSARAVDVAAAVTLIWDRVRNLNIEGR